MALNSRIMEMIRVANMRHNQSDNEEICTCEPGNAEFENVTVLYPDGCSAISLRTAEMRATPDVGHDARMARRTTYLDVIDDQLDACSKTASPFKAYRLAPHPG